MSMTVATWLGRLILGYLLICGFAFLGAQVAVDHLGETVHDAVAFGVPLVAGLWLLWKAADVDALDARIRETRA